MSLATATSLSPARGGWGWSNTGLITDSGQSLLVNTLFDGRLTQEMLDTMRAATPAARDIASQHPHLWTPLQTQAIFEGYRHVLGCYHLSGLYYSEGVARLYGSSRTGTISVEGTRGALVAPVLSAPSRRLLCNTLLRPTAPPTTPGPPDSRHSCDRSFVILLFGEQRPYDARHFIRRRDSHPHSRLASQHPVLVTAPLSRCAAFRLSLNLCVLAKRSILMPNSCRLPPMINVWPWIIVSIMRVPAARLRPKSLSSGHLTFLPDNPPHQEFARLFVILVRVAIPVTMRSNSSSTW